MKTVLHLHQEFKPIDGHEIDFDSFTFSGGEPHIKIKSDLSGMSEVTVTTRIQSFNDFGLLLLAIDALRNIRVDAIHLILPYFPGARQDRLMVNGEPLTVKVYADILNNQHLKSITIFDPHSEVTPALVNRCQVISNYSFVQQVLENLPYDVLLISPDGGALKKVYKLSTELGGKEVIECSKSRDVKTGKLSGFKVYADDLAGKPCLIVDDICDGGGTFIGLAKELKIKNAGQLYIAVSHGIFSKGFDELKKHFDGIYTTDAFKTIEEEGVTQIQLNELIN